MEAGPTLIFASSKIAIEYSGTFIDLRAGEPMRRASGMSTYAT